MLSVRAFFQASEKIVVKLHVMSSLKERPHDHFIIRFVNFSGDFLVL